MLASINPLVERSRNSRFAITFAAYLVGSVAGGALLGGLLGLTGAGVQELAGWSGTATAVAVVAVCAVSLALDLRVAGLPLPTLRRQVNENWLTEYREWVYGGGFGFQLGFGVVTVVTTSTVYVTFALAFLGASLPAGAAIGAVFGAARALPLILVTRVHEPAQLRGLVRRAHSWAPVAQRAALVSLLVTGTVAVAAVTG
jgi:MFS family permease